MARTFNITVVAAYVLCLVVAVTVSFLLQPLSGDLTRLGGYSENNYGWNTLEKVLFKQYAEEGRPEESYDVVVLGDSFSIGVNLRSKDDAPLYFQWSELFAKRTGLRVGLFHHNGYTAEKILASEGYKRSPPRVFVFEVSERTLKARLDGYGTCSSPSDSAVPTRIVREQALDLVAANRETSSDSSLPVATPKLIHDEPLDLTEVHRATSGDLLSPQLGYALDYLSHFADGLTVSKPVVANVGLSRASFFSSRVNSRLLVYGEDLDKAGWTKADWDNFGCTLLSIQNRVQTDKTAFVLFIVPDKLTAYAPYLADARLQHLSRLSEMLDAYSLQTLRTDKSVAALVASGVTDVYMPDDTHWGWFAHMRQADAIYDYLSGKGIIAPSHGH